MISHIYFPLKYGINFPNKVYIEKYYLSRIPKTHNNVFLNRIYIIME